MSVPLATQCSRCLALPGTKCVDHYGHETVSFHPERFPQEPSCVRVGKYFRGESRWRAHKAADYPDDTRNRASADSLHSLALYVEAQIDVPLIGRIAAFLVADSSTLAIPEAERMVSRYGFRNSTPLVVPEAHQEFLQELLAMCEAEPSA